MKVSVVVPVFNPGEHFGPCLRSLLAQSMAPSDCELIFVDDGSSDGTPARLDEAAATHEHVHVRHIPNSGWPGRPRNVGLDHARGEFVYFVDNDDWLGEEALERLYAAALADDADIVIGRVVGHGKEIPRSVFARNVHDATAATAPLGLLTPHKLFRRAMLERHAIRFPEGRRRLEDHVMVINAYFRARRISVLADYPCYHWVQIGRGQNASMRPVEPAGYFDNLREVLDIVDANVEPGAVRDRMYTHWFRSKALVRMGGRAFLRREPAYRAEVAQAVRAIVAERFPPRLDALLPYGLRLRASLVRHGSDEDLAALARFEAGLRGHAKVHRLRRDGAGLTLAAGARLTRADGRPPRLVAEGDRVHWRPPVALRGPLRPDQLDVTEALAAGSVQVVVSRAGDPGDEYLVPTESTVALHRHGEFVRPVVTAFARLDPATLAAGAPLPAGEWEVRAVVTVMGFSDTVAVRGDGEPLVLVAGRRGRLRARRAARARVQALRRRLATRAAARPSSSSQNVERNAS
jgi:poly(ribitol-phosphate) beta-N-acetylglucosaminyltransferase